MNENINLSNLYYLLNNKILKKKKSSIIKYCKKIKEVEINSSKIEISNLAKLNNNNINNSLENKIKDIDNIINSLKYVEYYSN